MPPRVRKQVSGTGSSSPSSGQEGKAAIKSLPPAWPLALKFSAQLLAPLWKPREVLRMQFTVWVVGKRPRYERPQWSWPVSRYACGGIPVGVHGRSSMRLYSSLIFDPVPKDREPRVHAWLVPLSAAFTPAHHTGLEDPSICLHAGQGATRVTLSKSKSRA